MESKKQLELTRGDLHFKLTALVGPEPQTVDELLEQLVRGAH